MSCLWQFAHRLQDASTTAPEQQAIAVDPSAVATLFLGYCKDCKSDSSWIVTTEFILFCFVLFCFALNTLLNGYGRNSYKRVSQRGKDKGQWVFGIPIPRPCYRGKTWHPSSSTLKATRDREYDVICKYKYASLMNSYSLLRAADAILVYSNTHRQTKETVAIREPTHWLTA